MFVILVYDAEEKRVAKFLKLCRRYLTWVQCSVFEGEITEAKLKKLLLELEKIMKKDYDSIILYQFRAKQYFERKVIGVDKGRPDEIFF